MASKCLFSKRLFEAKQQIVSRSLSADKGENLRRTPLLLGFIVIEIIKDFFADLFKYPVHHDSRGICLLLNMLP